MKLAFLGDSLTYGWAAEGAPVWAARYAPHGAKNFGVPGDRTDEVLARIDAGELDRFQPELVVLLVGTNDLGSGSSPREAFAGVRACVAALLARFPDARVLLLALFPRGDGGRAGYDAVAALNARLANLADDARVFFEDFSSAFSEPQGGVRASLYDDDGLHLALPGYAAWADALEPVLARFVSVPARPDYRPA